MKVIFVIPFLFLTGLFAQTLSESDLKKHQQKVAKSKTKGTVVVSLDTLFKAGAPYCLFKTAKETMGMKEFSVQTFDGKEHIYIKSECIPHPVDASKKECYWLFIFIGSGKTAEVNGALASGLPDYIVENNLIVNNALNAEAERRFLLLYPQKLSKPATPQVELTVVFDETTFVLVERDRTADVQIFGDRIKQDFKEIGYFTEDRNAENGNVMVTVTIYLPSGVKVATATYDQSTKEKIVVVTEKDFRTYHVEVNPAKQMEQLALFLVQRNYL